MVLENFKDETYPSSSGLKKVDYTSIFRLQIGSHDREVGRSGPGIFTMQPAYLIFTNKNTVIFTGRFHLRL